MNHGTNPLVDDNARAARAGHDHPRMNAVARPGSAS
ncbi:uncharacterized protein SOCE836_051730 [Sorangium cellulosum]|uniref:Uncharacterized protein n=1 Tax=Sorangium cellulosum TaxID=56 RepID=A0A4P2QSR0_SORCE|nr:uncharacterized protein SOCE836_051730 [Sorangium cellulosum]WCQ92397.1 hypothetical protein NQZ70_05138 [Sorangium sp. Soce836]